MTNDSINTYIREKVEHLMQEMGVKKVRLGEVLGGKPEEPRQQQFARAQRFLEGSGSIKIDVLVRLVSFFEKPLSYFLPNDSLYPEILNTGASKDMTKELDVIAESLRKIGMDEEFVKSELRQIQAMEAYNVERERKES